MEEGSVNVCSDTCVFKCRYFTEWRTQTREKTAHHMVLLTVGQEQLNKSNDKTSHNSEFP